MKTLIYCLCLVAVVTCQHDKLLPCNDNHPSSGGPALPSIPPQFQTQVEMTIVQKNITIDLTEYYDYVNNRGTIIFYKNGEMTRQIFDFRTHESFAIFENKTCHVRDMTNLTVPDFILSDGSGDHIKGANELFSFGTQFGETYVSGDEQIRGIPVDHWTSCLKFSDHNGTFNLDYYFSKQSYNTSSGTSPVPIRSIGTGKAPVRNKNGTISQEMQEFKHFIDFINFQPGQMKDETVFQIPIGVICNGSLPDKPIPKLPDFFTTGMETTNIIEGHDARTFTQQFYFDYQSQLLRVDDSGPVTKEDFTLYGNDPVTFIHDFNNSLLYSISPFEMNCTVTMVTSTPATQNGPPSHEWHKMRMAADMFNIGQHDFLYQGRKTWRGFDVEAWATYNVTSKEMIEVFFRQDSVSDYSDVPGPRRKRVPAPGRGALAPYRLMGIYSRVSQPPPGQPAMTTYRHVFGYTTGHPDAEVYDISMCYMLGHHYSYITITTEGTYETDVLHFKKEFYASLRSAIARGANVSVTRIGPLLVEDDPFETNKVRVYFKLLENIAGFRIKGANGRDVGISLQLAIESLKSTMEAGLTFDVQYPSIEQNFQVTKGSFWEISSSQTPSQSTGSSSRKYGPGSMAGLAVGMLVVGAILGLLAAYAIYKKVDTSVPYRVTD